VIVAEDAAADLLARCQVARLCPVDVDLLARRIGVAEVIERSGPGDGRLERHGDRTVIVVKAGARTARRPRDPSKELDRVFSVAVRREHEAHPRRRSKAQT
jgi:hypothetical protein